MKFLGAFKIYVYNSSWVGGQKSGKFVNVYNKEIVNGGRCVVKNMWNFVKVNFGRSLTAYQVINLWLAMLHHTSVRNKNLVASRSVEWWEDFENAERNSENSANTNANQCEDKC